MLQGEMCQGETSFPPIHHEIGKSAQRLNKHMFCFIIRKVSKKTTLVVIYALMYHDSCFAFDPKQF